MLEGVPRALRRLTAAVAVLLSVVAMGVHPVSTSSVLHQGVWASAQVGQLPTALGQIATYPLSYRLQVFRRMTPEQKSGLVHEQIGRFLAAHPILGKPQQDLIDVLFALSSPESYRNPTPAVLLSAERLGRRLRLLFPNEDLRAFYVVGHLEGFAPAVAEKDDGFNGGPCGACQRF